MVLDPVPSQLYRPVPIVVFSGTENKKKCQLFDLIAIIFLFAYYCQYLSRYCSPANSRHHLLLCRVSAFFCANSYGERSCGLHLITKSEVD